MGLLGAVGYFGMGKGGPFYANRRTSCAYALQRRLDPRRSEHVPFYIPQDLPHWGSLRQELLELRTPDMEFEEGVVGEMKLKSKG